jgi:acyl carrier protein
MKYLSQQLMLLFSLSFFSQIAFVQELEWVSKFGSTSNDISYSSANDAAGNLYVVGQFTGSVDFDPSGDYEALTSSGIDGFILKLDADGNYLWAKKIGGLGEDLIQSVHISADGNIVMGGQFSGTADLDPGIGIAEYTAAGFKDGFILVLDPFGNYVWSKVFGGEGNEENVKDITTDIDGNVFCIGYYSGAINVDPGASELELISNGQTDVFFVKYDVTGDFLNSKSIGGTGIDQGFGIVSDLSGNVYLTGFFYFTVDFDPSVAIENITSNGLSDVFLLKLDTDFNFLWAQKSVSGPSNNRAYSIALYDNSYLYLTGGFNSTADFDASLVLMSLTSNGNADAFIQKIDLDGNAIWAKNIGGTLYDQGTSITFDDFGNVYTTGYFAGVSDFDPGVGLAELTSYGGNDTYVLMLDSLGDYSWAVQFGGASNNQAYSISVFNSTSVYTAGEFSGPTNFDPIDYYNLSPAGGRDVFVHKLYHCLETTSTIDTSACTSYISPSGLYTWAESGIYNDTLVNAEGCDSVLTINLSILDVSESFITENACDFYISPSGLFEWTETGIYTDTLINYLGCDSIITVDLTVNYFSVSEIFVTNCDLYTSPSGEYVWNESGVYVDTIYNYYGCDSIITINLTILDVSESFITENACDSYISPSGLYEWTETGIYTDTLINDLGCDSIITIDLIINTSDYEISVLGNTISVLAVGATYQWIDCNNDYAVIDEATGADYTPESGSGNFAVIVNQGECSDTSDCFLVSDVAIEKYETKIPKIYPNPTAGRITVDNLNLDYQEAIIEVSDVNGKLIDKFIFNDNAPIVFEIKGSSGLYIMNIIVDGKYSDYLKVIKE